MNVVDNVIISLEERHAENIFNRSKTVEFRRRHMSVGKGTAIWIYVKRPKAVISGIAVVSETHYLAPSILWKKFSSVSGLTKQEFFEYFDGVDTGFAITFEEVVLLPRVVPLESLRNVYASFQPPQFFMRLCQSGPAANALDFLREVAEEPKLSAL